jgi:glycosyltransferase involved in cell wall biosynthesis
LSRADVLLDARITRRMSVGMIAYARQLALRLPRIAPDLRFGLFEWGGNFGFSEQVRLPLAILRERPRMVHFLALYAPLVRPRPFAITIHDLIHLRFPQYFKRSVGPYYRTVVRSACAQAMRVIVDDPRTADDLERFLGVDRAKVRVVPLGVDDAFLAPAEPEPSARPFFLYAGNHREHKNLSTLAAAWRALPAHLEADLFLTGDPDVPELTGLERPGGAVRFLGEVAPARLARLYRGAAAYVHPALCEGFGLPMLEAAAAGTPVIASSEAVPAVLAGVSDLFEPYDVLALTGLLARVLGTPVDDGQRRRRSTAAHAYTWDRCAAATAEVYREMLAEVGRT